MGVPVIRKKRPPADWRPYLVAEYTGDWLSNYAKGWIDCKNDADEPGTLSEFCDGCRKQMNEQLLC